MNGHVDEKGRALVTIRLRHPTADTETELDAWIDTGFTDELMLPITEITRLALPATLGIKVRLAEGSAASLDRYKCKIHWFGKMAA